MYIHTEKNTYIHTEKICTVIKKKHVHSHRKKVCLVIQKRICTVIQKKYVQSYRKPSTCFGYFRPSLQRYSTKKRKNTTLANYGMAVQL